MPPIKHRRRIPRVLMPLVPAPEVVARDRMMDRARDFQEKLKTDDSAVQAVKEKIIVHVAGGMSDTGAADKEGVKPSMFEGWKKEDPVFEQELIDAFKRGTNSLHDVAVTRAKDGSDRLIEFLLVGRDRDRFGKDGSTAPGTKPLSQMTIGELEARIAEARALAAKESAMLDITPGKATVSETVQE